MCLPDNLVRGISVHLLTNEFLHTITEFHHALDTLHCRSVQIGLYHAAVFSVVDIAVYHGVTVIFDIWVSGDRGVDCFPRTEFGQLCLRISATDIFHSIVKLIGKFQSLNGFNRKVLLAVLGAFRSLPSEYHFGMVDEITVDGKTVIVLSKVYPIGVNLNRTIPLLQEDNIGHNFRACICLESVVRQADRSKQFRSLSDIFSDFGRLLVHRVPARYESDHTARSNLIESLGEKIIMDRETEFVICPVIYLILTERHIADSQIVEVPPVGSLKSCYGNICFGIKLLCDSPCDAVQLHAVEPAVLHRFGKQSKKVAHAH